MPAPFHIDPEKVVKARSTLGLTQQQLAERAEVSLSTKSNLENTGNSSHPTVQRVAQALSVTIDELLPGRSPGEDERARLVALGVDRLTGGTSGLGSEADDSGSANADSEEYFDSESPGDAVLEASPPWVRQPLGITISAVILGNLLLAALVIYWVVGAKGSRALDHQILSDDLANHAPDVFYGRTNTPYEFGRVIPRNASLRDETNFVKELGDTVYSFDMLANTAGVVREQWLPIIEEGLRRGVDYRIILSDYRESNHRFEDFSKSVNEQTVLLSRGASIEHHKQLEALLERIKADEAKGKDRTFRGTLQVKWNPRVLLYTMWIRDAREKDALAHLGVHFYQGKNQWPNFRFSKEVAPDMVENMVTEFEEAWQSSLDYGDLPFPPEEDEGEP